MITRNLFFIMLFISAFNITSQAALNIEFKGDDGNGITQYAKTLLNERLEALAGDGERSNLFVHFNISQKLSQLGAEGYQLEVKNGGVHISATSEQGILYGAVVFIEWVIQQTSPYLIDKNQVDIDFGVMPGQAKDFLKKLPDYSVSEKPFYSLRGIDLSNFALGVPDLIDTDKGDKFVCRTSGQPGGFKDSAYEWKKWCDWLARHKMNYIGNWPYSMGTNWWELVCNPETEKMTPYTSEEINKAAKIREELLKYARDRGLTPYLMNYVLGAPNPTIIKNYPEFMGPRQRPEWPAAFCMSSPGLEEKFVSQIRAIVKAYPSLGGLHFRWWGESFPCHCPKCEGQWQSLLHEYTLAIVNAALEVRPDLDIRITGWIRGGGNKEIADRLPRNVIIQTKWGIDWEPTSFPNVPYSNITEVKQRFLISQCLPGEEFHQAGCVQYKGLQAGIRQYSKDKSKIPNLEGFSTLAAEKDHEWITGLNFVAMARLNWDPFGTDTKMLAKNFIASQLCLRAEDAVIADKIQRALDLTQDVWETYCIDFGGVTHYYDCYRLYELFHLKRVKTLSIEALNKALPGMEKYSKSMQNAMDSVMSAQQLYMQTKEPKNQVFMEDIVIQTEVLSKFIASRLSMTQAFIYLYNKNFDMAEAQLEEMKKLDQELLDAMMKKPNISDDFEFEGMIKPIHMPERVEAEQKEIDEMLQKIAELEKL